MSEKWIIRHPGKGEYIVCESFDECMSKWFEGFNIPQKIAVEDCEASLKRIRDYYLQR